MMFTYGNTESYEQYFREDATPRKLGIRDNYQGGIVFETADEAEQHLQKKGITGYTVYGLDTTSLNRHRVKGEEFWRLKESCDLIRLMK